MGTFAEQLQAARKAAHLTQDQLAEQVHVTRAAISHWENGRYIPDFDMIRTLSQVLHCHFEVNNEGSGTEYSSSENSEEKPEKLEAYSKKEAAGNAGIHEPEIPGDEPETKNRGRKNQLFWIIATIAVIAAAVLIVLRSRTSGETKTAMEYISMADETVRYRIEDYKAVTPREEGKAYLTINTESRVEHGENTDYWMYDFVLHEDQGKSIHVQQIEQVIFVGNRAHVSLFPEKDLQAFQIGPEIEANQTCVFTGGFPMAQREMQGVGLKVFTRDENGQETDFTAYIPFPE